MNREHFAAVTLAVAAGATALFLPRAAHGAPVANTVRAFAVTIVNGGGSCTSEFCYTPANLIIRQADSVTWINNSTAIHTVTRCTTSLCPGAGPGTGTDPAFNSGVGIGSKFTVQFHRVGTYHYYRQIHGFFIMHGTVTVKPFIVSTVSLPAGKVRTAYSSHLMAAGGQLPLTWRVVAGKLPAGLRLSVTGIISGTPTAKGTSTFTVQVLDSSRPTKLMAKKSLSIFVS
jgi:plastocyanin